MYHYTYIIKDKYSNHCYIGSRTSTCLPKDDINYWGSSKYIPDDVKTTHKKRILQVFKTRTDALQHEIYLHNKYNVHTDPKFYNKAKQTSTKFDTTGTKLTEEHKEKCSKALKGKSKPLGFGDKISKALTGKPKSESHCKAVSIALQKTDKNKGSKNPRFKPWFITYNNVTKFFFNTSKKDKALQDGLNSKQYTSIMRQCKKSGLPIQKGKFKGMVVGDLPQQYKI